MILCHMLSYSFIITNYIEIKQNNITVFSHIIKIYNIKLLIIITRILERILQLMEKKYINFNKSKLKKKLGNFPFTVCNCWHVITYE